MKYVFLASLVLVAAPTMYAADGTWTGGTSATWATSTNWSGGTVPGSTTLVNSDIANFNSATYSFAPTAANGYFIGGLSFGSSNGALLFTTGTNNNRLNVGSAGMQVAAGSGAVTIGNAASQGINLTANQNWTNNDDSLLTVSRVAVDDVAAIGTYTLTINGAGTGGVTVSSNVADVNNAADASRKLAVIINSTGGATNFANGSTYSGGTTLTAGLLQIGGASSGTVGAITSSSLGTGSLTLNGGTLSSGSTNARTILNAVTIGGNVTLGDATNTGILTFSAGMDLNAGTRTLTTASPVTLAGIVSNGALTKAGAGTLTLTAANSYTGATTISAGTLHLGNGTTGNDGTLASTSVVNNGALVFNRFGSASYSGVISGTGNVTKSGAGTQTLSGANTFSGTTTISAGTLELTDSLALQNSALDTGNSIAGDATNGLKITTTTLMLGGLTGNKELASVFTTTSGGYSGVTVLTLNPGAGANNSYNQVIADGAAGMSLIKTGAGTQAFSTSGANTYSGGTTLNAGTLQINFSSTGAVGAITAGSLGTGSLTLNSGTLSTAGTTGRSIFNATTLGGNVTLGDATNNGTLTFSAGVNLGGSARTLTTASNVNFDGIVSNGGIIKEGAGTLRIRGDATYAGGFTLNAGVVTINTNGIGSVGAITSSAFGTGALTLNGGTVSSATGTDRPIQNAVTFGGNVGFGGGSGAGAGGIIFQAAADLGGAVRTLTTVVDTTFNGIVSNGGITKDGSVITANTLTLAAANTYSGATTITAGTLNVTNSLAMQNSALNTTGSITGDATNGLKTTLTTLTLGGLTGNKDLASVFTTTSGGYSGVTALSLNPGASVSNSYSGVIADGAAAMSVTKTGVGTQILTAANIYSGPTTISAGTLQVGSSGVGTTGTGAVSVQTGSVIQGTGVVQGSSFTAQSGSTVHAGDTNAQSSYGTLTFAPVSGSGSFDFQAGSSVILGINPGGTSDLLNFVGTGSQSLLFNGNLTVGPGSFIPTAAEIFDLLDWTLLGGTPIFASRFNASSYSGYLFGNGDDNLGLDLPNISGSGFGWDIGLFTSNGSIALVAIPEPSRALLLMLGLVGVAVRRRRVVLSFGAEGLDKTLPQSAQYLDDVQVSLIEPQLLP